MEVRLISYTANPQHLVATAAKLCYSSGSCQKLLEDVDEKEDEKFVEKLLSFGHESPIEHANFTFLVEGVSRALLAQITRHRIASFSVKSQRYVNENDFDFVIPPEIDSNEKAKNIFLKSIIEAKKNYSSLFRTLKEKYINEGIKEVDAKKKAAQDARFVLPNACTTNFMVSMNARSLMNFFKLRCCYRAQWEICNLAWEMLGLVKRVAPNIFKDAGPSCISGSCSEGNMCCGKFNIVRERFRNIKG